MELGAKIKDLRVKNGLTQQELADRTELSKGYISQLETDVTSPSIATLADILQCLGTNLGEFFSGEPSERIVFDENDMFTNDNDEVKITWLVPDSQKNDMEPILMQIGPGGSSQEMPPHEGEEFGYVLSGSVMLRLGERKFRVKTGGSFCIHPTAAHCLINTGKRPARVLWVSTPPSF